MIKTLTSFFRFYYYILRKSPKRFDIAMGVNEGTVTAITPLFLFLGFVFGSIVFGEYHLAMFFPLAIPLVLGNMLVVHKVRERGYEIQREIREQQREAERLQREYEREQERRRHEERMRQLERERRKQQEEMDRIMREFFERMRQKQQQQQRQQQRQSNNNNMANAMKLLGLTEGFTEKDVKKAYRRLSKIHHPDVGGKEANFLKLKKAYDYVMERI
jgi:ABC-type multidrug transport system fused ATPase/permease subunit